MIDSLWVAIATYSRLPTPRSEWTTKSLRYSLCFFPLVGVAVGALELIWWSIASWLQLGAFLTGAVGCAVPILVTGGIHMDGFMDTVDALSSRKPRAEMLKILKDSHVGAFAAMGCTLYLIMDAGALSQLPVRESLALAASFVVSRALSAFFVAVLPAARPDGMAKAVKDAAVEAGVEAVKRASVGWAVVFGLIMLWLAPASSVIALIWAAAAVLLYMRVVKRFGGVTGDLAGWFLQVCELGFALSLALGGKIG
jgi:adenosylcobinamide-GDP ribazoletransferase